MVLSRFGIGARLFIAFVVITAVSLSSGVASWVVLREISGAQSRLISQALPAVAAAQRTADVSARLVAATPSLTAATDEATRQRQAALLASLVAEVSQSVQDAGLFSLGDAEATELSRTVNALTSNLPQQNALVRERIALESGFRDRTARAIIAATGIVDLSETLVSNASSATSAVIANLYGLIEDVSYREDAYEALDRLTEQDIYLMGRMFELRLRSSQIGLLANQLTRAISEAEVMRIASEYNENLRVIRRRVGSIDDPIRREQAADFLVVLETASGISPWDESLFGQRVRLIEISEQLDRVAAANATLSSDVSRIAQTMLSASRDFAGNTATQAGEAVNTGFYSLIVSSLLAIFISGLIVWLYIERHVVRRLGSLATAMQRLTDGDLNVDVTDEGTHELRALSKAVRAFRDESQQRRMLEFERERTNEELRRHREELQVLVEERTRQLQDANVELQHEVTSHAEARKKAEIANRAKSDFLATMSHEIRTPMTGMLGMLRILRTARLNQEQRHRLDIATKSGEALLGILNSILDYSKIESGSIVVEQVSFNVKDALAGVVELMRPSAVEKHLKLSFSFDRSMLGDNIGDAGKLRQIVFNLISNAIKFTDSGRVSVVVRRLSQTDEIDRLAITVADSGIGIAANDLDRIFEPFTQTDTSITRRFGGTGLGLAISRRLAEAMDGKLALRSAPLNGSHFTLTIALRRTSAVPQSVVDPSTRPRRFNASLRIVAVEDDPATRIVVESFLAGLGHRVVVAADGFQALDLVASQRPDVVIIDVSLPGMDGIEVARRIRAIDGLTTVPILAMSAHVYKDEIARYLQAGMDGFVGKPLTPEALAEALDAIHPAPSNRSPDDFYQDSGDTQEASSLDLTVLGGDVAALGQATVIRILDAAERTLPLHLAALREALEIGDLPSAAQLAHVIRSAAAAAGFSVLHDSAEALERAAKAGDSAPAFHYLVSCETAYPPAIAAARRLVMGQT